MRLSFNTAGPCVAGRHYLLPPLARVTRAMELVDDHKFFSLVAGHQSGKTTCLRWMADHYNRGDGFRALWVDLQTARDMPEAAAAMPVILDKLLAFAARVLPEAAAAIDRAALLAVPETALVSAIRALAAGSPLPLVLFFDEADGLVGATMVSFLAQLRDGYLDRSETPFAASVALVGRRAVRDDTLSTDERRPIDWLGTSSPFNVNAEVTSVELFTRDEVAALLAQHTENTGQPFEADAAAQVFELSEGQPWLVNALADYAVDRLVRDRSLPVTRAHIDAAKEALILDLLLVWKTQRVAIEVKLRRDTETEEEALEQVAGYLDSLGLREGWLVLFDLRATTPWRERTYLRDVTVGDRTVHIAGG